MEIIPRTDDERGEVSLATPEQEDSKKYYETVGANIMRLRKERGMHQYQIAERVGVTRQTILAMEKGRIQGKLRNYDLVAKALGVDIGLLLGGTHDYLESGSATTRSE